MTFKVRLRQKGDNAAAAFALERHGEQAHGCLKIGDHLSSVVANVRKYYNPHVNILALEDVVAAAWCHDLVEDTDVTSDEISSLFGEGVGDLVELLTDKAGKNRLERHLRTYHMIRTDPDAVLIKLCDRLHNHARSIQYGERYATMYRDEFLRFKFALYKPGQFDSLWAALDEQYKQLEDSLTW
jgi:(p)ppGpp synthase/HD superfamily hydrolase